MRSSFIPPDVISDFLLPMKPEVYDVSEIYEIVLVKGLGRVEHNKGMKFVP